MVLPGVSTRWISATVRGSMDVGGRLRLVSTSGPTLRDCERGSGQRIGEEIGPGEHDGVAPTRAAGNEFFEMRIAVSMRSGAAEHLCGLAALAHLGEHDVVAAAADVADPVGRAVGGGDGRAFRQPVEGSDDRGRRRCCR